MKVTRKRRGSSGVYGGQSQEVDTLRLCPRDLLYDEKERWMISSLNHPSRPVLMILTTFLVLPSFRFTDEKRQNSPLSWDPFLPWGSVREV